MRKPSWTKRQKAAIDARGRDILVTASAGTGKTAVLTERYLQCLLEPIEPAGVSEILALTFTDAAAEEMRSRIAERLRRESMTTHNPFLRAQLLQLDTAWISTLHSFCKRILTEFFYEQSLDPAFRILDADEQMLLKNETLQQIIEEAWEDPELSPGLEQLLYRRDLGGHDRNFLSQILRAADFLDSVASRSEWLNRAGELSRIETLHGEWFLRRRAEMLTRRLQDCLARVEFSRQLDAVCTDGYWSDFLRDEFPAVFRGALRLLEEGQWDVCRTLILTGSFPSFPRRPKTMSEETADRVKAAAMEAKRKFLALRSMAIVAPDYEQRIAASVHLQTRILIELIGRFDRGYARAKLRRNSLDFADLEHRALEMLTSREDVAEILRRRFRCIFLDEYQDINPIQQALIDRIRRRDNVFVVGDVKQSIYAFRQSRPEIFLARLDGAVEALRSEDPLRVDLIDNFRSRQPILDFSNQVFRRIMRFSVASIDYDSRALLQPGFEYAPLAEGTVPADLVELCILDEPSSGSDSDDDSETSSEEARDWEPSGVETFATSSQRQAAWIAERIRAMVGADTGRPQFTIFDKAANAYRDVAYGDIVILMRSLSHSASEYVEVLQQAGVPVSSQSAAGYFSATEIGDMLALLKVLDNPRRDIELAAVLRSAMFGLSDNQLMQIRLCVPEKSGDYYEALRSAVRDSEDAGMRDRIAAIFRQLDDWRSTAHAVGIAEMIHRVYRDTGYLTFMSALPNGRQRRANLLKLHDRAVQFESFTEVSRSGSLARFVEFLEKLLDQDRDWATAEPDAAENAVRILSVHKSKGLEFPVVFLANLERRFNFRDLGDDCVFDDEDALGLKIIEPILAQKFPSVVHELIVDKRHRRGLAEEMRILYVAVTRARERLILTASAKLDTCRRLLDGCRLRPEGPQDWQLRDVKNLFEWILYGLADVKSMYSAVGLDPPTHATEIRPCRFEILTQEASDRLAGRILAHKRNRLEFPLPANPAEDLAAQTAADSIRTALQWKYPFLVSTGLRAKLSVSELTHREDEYAVSDVSDCLHRRPSAMGPSGTTGRPDARLLGSAIHSILQHIDLSMPPSRETILAAGERAVGCNQIPASILRHIDPDSIAAFFRTEPGRLALDHAKDLLREWPFTFALPADQLAEEFSTERAADPENFVIVQGIVDMIIPGKDGLTVIDFKTDRVESSEVALRAVRYQAQMHYYCMAAKGILQKPIRGSFLYFLYPGALFPAKDF